MINIKELDDKEVSFDQENKVIIIETEDIRVTFPPDTEGIEDVINVFNNKNIMSEMLIDVPVHEIVVKDKVKERTTPDDYDTNDLYAVYDYGRTLKLSRSLVNNAYIEILGNHRCELLKVVFGLDDKIQIK